MKKKIEFMVVLATIAFVSSAVLGNFSERQKITSIPRGVGAQHGNAVAISGNTMVVGAQFDPTMASQAGAVFVYILDGTTWTQQAQFLASDGAVADKFGHSVAIDGDTIVVGAYNDDAPLSNGGSAYVFVRNGTTWSFQQKLTASDGTADDEFGNAVEIFETIDGKTIVVGAHFADLPGNSQAGSAYVFRRNGTVWTETQKLIPVAQVVLGDHFGESVAVGDFLVIGASGDDTPETAAGAVYVFGVAKGSSQFELVSKLTIGSGTNGDRFGCSVAMEGITLVAGAREDAPAVGQTARGSAYVFAFNGGSTFTLQGQLLADDGAAFDRFGWSVAISDGIIAVGAREDDTTVGPDAGSAYIFTRNGTTWTQQEKLTPADPFNGDRFGISTAFTEAGNLVIGAAEKQLTNPNGQGAAYYFTLPPPSTRFDLEGDGKADIAIFRPVNGQWWYEQSSDHGVRAFQFGTPNDKPVPADFDGDGRTDVAIYRPSTGEWFVLRSSNLTFFSAPFGVSTDQPVPSDYEGDGLDDIAVFRPSEGTWYANLSSGGVRITPFGTAGDIPVAADYDGDGRADTAIYRPSNGQWWLNRTTTGVYAVSFGTGTDKPVPADFTGDGKTDVAVWRPGNGQWYVLRSEDNSFYAAPFGATGDIPVPADYDGDGQADLGVFRPDGANWFLQRSTQGILIQQFGLIGDVPVPSAFVP